MATRSKVYIQEADGSLHGCYIYNDGYPSERGFERLAHAEAGTLGDFIAENCEDNVEEDGQVAVRIHKRSSVENEVELVSHLK